MCLWQWITGVLVQEQSMKDFDPNLAQSPLSLAMSYRSFGTGAIYERLWCKPSIISYEFGNELPEFWSRSGAPWPRSGRCGGSSAGQCPSGPCRHAGYHLQPPKEQSQQLFFFGGLECVGHSFAYVAHFVSVERTEVVILLYRTGFKIREHHYKKKQCSLTENLCCGRTNEPLLIYWFQLLSPGPISILNSPGCWYVFIFDYRPEL